MSKNNPVKGPLPFFLELLSQFLRALFTMHHSFDGVPLLVKEAGTFTTMVQFHFACNGNGKCYQCFRIYNHLGDGSLVLPVGDYFNYVV